MRLITDSIHNCIDPRKHIAIWCLYSKNRQRTNVTARLCANHCTHNIVHTVTTTLRYWTEMKKRNFVYSDSKRKKKKKKIKSQKHWKWHTNRARTRIDSPWSVRAHTFSTTHSNEENRVLFITDGLYVDYFEREKSAPPPTTTFNNKKRRRKQLFFSLFTAHRERDYRLHSAHFTFIYFACFSSFLWLFCAVRLELYAHFQCTSNMHVTLLNEYVINIPIVCTLKST